MVEVRRVIQNTAEWPALAPQVAFPSTSTEVRRAGLRRYPYGIVHVVRDDVLWVLAIAHSRRAPDIGMTGYDDEPRTARHRAQRLSL